jgi:hypothetical protein
MTNGSEVIYKFEGFFIVLGDLIEVFKSREFLIFRSF